MKLEIITPTELVSLIVMLNAVVLQARFVGMPMEIDVKTGMATKSQFIKDLKDREAVSSPFLVKFSAIAVDKNGKPYMNLVLVDQSGEIEGRIWDDVSQHIGQVVRDNFVWIDGRCQSYQGRRQIVINKIQILREDQVDAKQYIAESPVNFDALYSRLTALIDTLTDPHYKALALSVFKDDADVSDRLKRAPAAKSFHHAYRTGLLEHMVSVSVLLDQVAKHYGGAIDRDLLMTSGLLHDIGKLWELSYDRVTDYTTEGKLIGHLVLGVEYVGRKIAALEAAQEAFPEEKKLLLKHLLLSHHGELEFGSPKRPKCLEAVILHYVDDLDSKVNAITHFIEQDQTPGAWTAMNRNYDRFFYKTEGFRENAK